jgi:hypothetical protein
MKRGLNKMAKKYFKKPKGFVNFTEYSEKNKKEFKKKGYKVRTGRNPYSPRGGKVLFYKKKR